MATSARQAQLQAQRSGYNPYGSSGRIRILAPSNNSIASIAKKTAANELNVMVARYNNGEISNEDMRNFLTKMSTGIGVSDADRLEVQTQIKDFDSRIVLEKLTANYKAAPDNSLAQLQAAQAISSYHNERASGQQPGTPAQSTSLQNAADWNNRALSVKESINKVASQNLRYREELKVNSISDNTSEQAQQKASMWQALYDKAVADGDEVGANKYAAYYQDAITKATDLSEKESVKGEKDDIKNALNSYVNMYHDGQINEQQYLQLLAEISPRVDATGDYGLINSLNRTTDTIQKNLDKGGLKRGTTAGGLPTVLGKNKGGSGSGVVTDWDQQDYDYTDSLRKAKQALDKGTIDAAKYRDIVGKSIMTHYNDINNMISVLEETSSVNPNTKIMFEGKKTKVSDALDKLYSDQEDLAGQAQAVEKGKFALVEVPPGEFNESGKVTTGKSFATYKPIDTNNLPKDQYVADNEGIFHFLQKETRPLTLEEQANVYNGTLAGADGKLYKVKTDSSGNQSLETGGQSVKIYKPGTSESRDVAPDKTGIVPGWTATDRMIKQDVEKKKFMNNKTFVEARNELFKGVPAGYNKEAKMIKSQAPINPTQKIASVANQVMSAVTPDANAQVVNAKVVAPKTFLPPTASVKGANIPSATNNIQPLSNFVSQPKAKTLQIAQPSAITKMVQSTGQAPKPIQAPNNYKYVAPATFNKQAEEARKKANNPVGTVINQIKGFFRR